MTQRILKGLAAWCDTVARARAASELARLGYQKEAERPHDKEARMIKFLKMLLVRDRKSQIEKYLASSSDLVELERRQQELARKGIWV